MISPDQRTTLNVVDTDDNNVVATDDEAANGGTATGNDEPLNTDAPAFVGPRIVWAAVTADDGMSRYRLGTIGL